ncbi:hypothetical protein [Rhodanobacter lindaniclasticus]
MVVENIHRPAHGAGWTHAAAGDPRGGRRGRQANHGQTFTVIAALLPMALVSGLMGPYMRPIPMNAWPACCRWRWHWW